MRTDFKPEDFLELFPFDNQIGLRVDCADKANAKLEEWMNNAPIVCGTVPDHPRWRYEMEFHGVVRPEDTHVANIINIRKIKR